MIRVSFFILGACLAPAVSAQGTFKNPPIWEDLADIDVLRVNDTFYLSSSTMHFSPGAPVLQSPDLVHWEYIGHSVPKLDFGSNYDLTRGRAYNKGIWASFFNRRKDGKWIWGGCIESKRTYIYESEAPQGPWHRIAILPKCYYDCGVLVDNSGEIYLAFGQGTISVVQLSSNARQAIRTQEVFRKPANFSGTLEGSRFYKHQGYYYILVTRPPNAEYVLRSRSPFGRYEMKPLVDRIASPIPRSGSPHQGGPVEGKDGQWYYVAFIDAYPGGRVPAVAPVRWESSGWPRVVVPRANNAWGTSYSTPRGGGAHAAVAAVSRVRLVDDFAGPRLGAEWEWNHNPDEERFRVGKGLVLTTASLTDDLYAARNTLTRRIPGPVSTASVVLDIEGMRDGDDAGLVVFKDSSSWIGVQRRGTAKWIVAKDSIIMDVKSMATKNKGRLGTRVPVSGNKVWLRATADVRPGSSNLATYKYSTDGTKWQKLGSGVTLHKD